MIDIRNADINLLVAFDALYDERNVTRAAARLHLTQPTVSGMLNRLRQLFGDRLFVRTQHGILPTPRADALSKPIKVLLADVEALIRPEIFDPKAAQMTFSISANDYMQYALVVPLIGLLRRQAPGIRIAVLPAYIADLSEKLTRGEADLALTIPEFAVSELPAQFLYREKYVCIARKSHPLTGAKISLQDFFRFDHLLVSPTGGAFSGPTDEALKDLGLKRRVAVSLPSFHVLLETVRTDDFLALAPERLVHGRMSGLKIFDQPITVPDFDVIACWHSRLETDPAHLWIRGVLSNLAKGMPTRI